MIYTMESFTSQGTMQDIALNMIYTMESFTSQGTMQDIAHTMIYNMKVLCCIAQCMA